VPAEVEELPLVTAGPVQQDEGRRHVRVAVGFSNGANIAAATLLRRPGLLRAGVLVSSMLPFRPEAVPDLSSTAALLVQGRVDPYAPAEQAEALAELLAEGGAAVDLRWHDDGHALGPAQAEVARAWLQRLMAGTAASPGTSPA
jgi:phospholipase/carboxylesterase